MPKLRQFVQVRLVCVIDDATVLHSVNGLLAPRRERAYRNVWLLVFVLVNQLLKNDNKQPNTPQ